MNHDALIEQLRAWADALAAATPMRTDDGRARDHQTITLAHVITAMREVADDLERDQPRTPYGDTDEADTV